MSINKRHTIAWLDTLQALAARDDTAARFLVDDETEARFFLRGLIESEWREEQATRASE